MVGERTLLRVYLLATDQTGFTPTFERLVVRAERRRMAGATVLRGIYGFGTRGLDEVPRWHWAESLPVIVEVVDTAEKIAAFVHEELNGALHHGMATLERAGVLFYRHRHATEARTPLELLGRIANLSTVPQINGSPEMKVNEDGVLLRVFAGESDTVDGQDLYKAVIQKARELGLSGGTVLRGAMGFGANSVLHTTKVLALSTDLPIVIELVDTEENIRKLLPFIDAWVKEGMVTMEAVRILMYRHNPQDAGPEARTP